MHSDADKTRGQRRRRTRTRWTLFGAAMLGAWLIAANAPADVQEQRARLPPPAKTCSDPVEGVWRAHAYYPFVREWYVFELTIERVRGRSGSNELQGHIDAEFWDGEAADASPPPCREGALHVKVFETARGLVEGEQIHFRGTAWRPAGSFCDGRGFDYNLDDFRGTIDPELLEFQSVLNDGEAWVDVPTVFRRVRCLDRAAGPRPIVRPPPFQPPGRAGGCSCGW